MITVYEHKKAISNLQGIDSIEEYLASMSTKGYSPDALKEIKSYANICIRIFKVTKKSKSKPINKRQQDIF